MKRNLLLLYVPLLALFKVYANTAPDRYLYSAECHQKENQINSFYRISKKRAAHTFPSGGRCPRRGRMRGRIAPHQSKIKDFCQLPPKGKLCACGA